MNTPSKSFGNTTYSEGLQSRLIYLDRGVSLRIGKQAQRELHSLSELKRVAFWQAVAAELLRYMGANAYRGRKRKKSCINKLDKRK